MVAWLADPDAPVAKMTKSVAQFAVVVSNDHLAG